MDPSTDVADYWNSEMAKERRGDVLHVRVPKSLMVRIKQVADFWTKKARIDVPDAKEVSTGDVVVRLMAVGIEGIWTDANLPSKPTQAEIDALIRSMKSPS